MDILQINLHHSKLASLALINRMATEQSEFIFFQVPWVYEGRICGLRAPNYKLYKANCEGKVRTCMLAKKNLNAFLSQEPRHPSHKLRDGHK